MKQVDGGASSPATTTPSSFCLNCKQFRSQKLQRSDFAVAVATLKEPRPAAGEFSIHFGVLPAAAKHCSAAGASSKISTVVAVHAADHD